MPLLRRIVNLFLRQRVDCEIDAELRSHIEMRTEDNVSTGMTPDAARRAAEVQFGNRTATRERVTGVDAALAIESTWFDVRYAFRQLAKNPGFAFTAILVLALGICSSVAIFAFVDASLIKPLPYSEPKRLVALFESMTLGARYHISYLDFRDWQRLNQVFSSLDVYDGGTAALMTPSGSQNVDSARVSDGFLRTLGVAPALGRDFTAGEDLSGPPHTVLLSYAAWQQRYGGREDVLGQSVTLNGKAFTVIGVLPRDFHFAPAEPSEFWTLIDTIDGGCEKDRGCHSLSGVARLKDGVTIGAAAADMTNIAAQLARQYPGDDGERGATVLPLAELIVGNLRPILLVLLSGAALLLLIACINVASLLLVRSESRKREIAVRGAMGASPARLLRQLVTEGLVLVTASTLLGLAAAGGAMRLLLTLIPTQMLAGMPFLRGLGFNPRVIAFACALALVAALLFSLVPAFRLSKSGLGVGMRDALASGGRGSAGTVWRRFGANLVVIELAVTMTMLVCAGLLGESLYRLLRANIGFHPEQLVALRLIAPPASYSTDAKIAVLEKAISARVASLPGVSSVGTTSVLPVGNGGGSITFHVIGRPDHGEHIEVVNRQVSASYFATIGARLLRGRGFTADDNSSSPPVMIVNRTMAAKHFPGEDPIGKKIAYDETTPPKEVIGIVDDIQEGQLDSAIGPALYTPFEQEPGNRVFVVARTSLPGQVMLDTIATAVREIDPKITTTQPTVFSDRIHDSWAAYLHRSAAWLTGGFAAMALLLSVVGLYGVIAYSVSQRTREIGVRMALGAERGAVYALVVKEAAWLTAAGAAAGLVCSIAAASLMRSLLFGTSPWDAPTLVAVVAVLAACAMAASFIPAYRAARVNPVEALRAE